MLQRRASSRRWDISIKEATPDAVSRAVLLAAGGQKVKYGALQAGWMPATPDEQARQKVLSHVTKRCPAVLARPLTPSVQEACSPAAARMLAVRHLMPSCAVPLVLAEEARPGVG